MQLPQANSKLIVVLICLLPLALLAGCTGPPRGTGRNATNSTNSTSLIDTDVPQQFADDYSNTTN